MADQKNRFRGTRYRELIALQLGVEGLSARQPERPKRLSERVAEYDGPRSDVMGLEGWMIHVRADLQPKWGSALDAVEQAAALTGTPNAVLIEFRRDRPASEHFVLMTVSQLARLIGAAS